MSNISFVVVITDRELEGVFDNCLHNVGLNVMLSSLGHGTGTPGILDLLGLEQTEKSVIMALAKREDASRALKSLTDHIGLNTPGRGIALTVPVSSTIKHLISHLKGETPIDKQEESLMDISHELIMAITDKDQNDLVMDAARSAGAQGGTVLHAKGTAGSDNRKFFGISLAEERDIVMIVVRKEDKADVMRAIARDAGIMSEAHTILFSLPVTEVAGLSDRVQIEAK